LSIYVIYASVSHETTSLSERPPGPGTRREAARAGLRLFTGDGYDSVSAGDIAGGGRHPGADPRPALPTGMDCQSGMICQ
jgi:hypothetical protein